MLLKVLRLPAIGLSIAAILTAAVYTLDMRSAYARVQDKGNLIASPYGDIEYTESGTGPDVLVIHGSGGGYDQGELFAQVVLGEGLHIITPSRFGYLRSTFHEGATSADQAEAYAYLLDHLGITKVAVVAVSAGGPSALDFALLHPDRVSSLTLVSCGVATSASEAQQAADLKGTMLVGIVKYDFPYWFLTHAFNKQFMGLMRANDAVIGTLTPQQQKWVEQTIDYMNPASLRAAGAAFDNTMKTGPGERIAGIKAPTLIIHATDDTLQVYHNAEFAVSTILHAQLLRFERGGHFVMIVEQPTIRAAVRKHILDHVNEPVATSR